MSIINSISSVTGRVAGDVRHSVRRARLEGERRVLERRHRTALEALGARAYALSIEDALTADALAPELAIVAARLGEIDDALAAMDSADIQDPPQQSADIAFPMVADGPEDITPPK